MGRSVFSRNKSTQVNWPLSSSPSLPQNLAQYFTKKQTRQKLIGMRGTGSFWTGDNTKLDVLVRSKSTSLLVEKGTKRITHILDANLPLEKTNNQYSTEKHVCSTCKEEINSEISRVLIMRDKDGGPRLLLFHFFFPCWDMNLLCQKYPNLIIDKLGFSFPENITMTESSMKDMQKNPEFWTC